MPKDIRVRFGERIRELRVERGYTQQRLAVLAKVDYKHIQRLESKDPPAVRIDTMEKLAQAFHLSLSKLLDFDN